LADLNALRDRALSALDAASDLESLNTWRLAYLGRQGEVSLALREVGTLPSSERAAYGSTANALRTDLEARLADRQGELEAEAMETLEAGSIDVSLPGRRGLVGRLHPITQTQRDMLAVLTQMGFQVTEGPEVELDYYNFEALRLGKDHPARDSHDTFWLDNKHDDERFMLLRTHTSPNQIRFMEKHEPPIRVSVPGRVYRYEATDATHEWMFHQVELLAVDEGISMKQMKGTLTQFARALFGQERQVRFRCDFFPYVEPGAEIAIDCGICNGKGCRSCGGEGWLEIGGAGMVHPDVLRGVGYDPERYTGFAAGFGIERIAMLRHGIEDLRHFYANDLRFLRQF
jgi:phenylalanyl-tRNA synthetase alpha chain